MCPDHAEKRDFLRVDHETPLNFKILTGDKFTAKSDIMSRNISASGLLFRTSKDSSIPAISNIIWVELDERMINICSEIEEDLVSKSGGVFGRVVRISEGEPGMSYDVGVCFLRKKDLSEEEIVELLSK
ncbi:MAG: PilZ domain-containing protein [Candidatus Omnitrophota bacterium]|nr:PilZ domain-containing protein [Candidatus Omnitrophota bacterium]